MVNDNLAESALLTLWPNLQPWHDYLVLVGGLVPRYLCKQPRPGELPLRGTLDADFGILLGAEAGGMVSLNDTLVLKGFNPPEGREGRGRYTWKRDGLAVPVDFLTDHPPHTTGTAQVADITANVLPGIERAFQVSRHVHIDGVDLWGQPQAVNIRVCEVGPFLALKLRAFHGRQKGKDAFDVLNTVLNYDQGPEAAAKAFAEEIRAGNGACADALTCLDAHFQDERSLGPQRAVEESASSTREERMRIRQQMVDAARLLQAHCA